MDLDCIVLDHSGWDSNLAIKTNLARTRRIEVILVLVANCDEWFPSLTICDTSLESMSD